MKEQEARRLADIVVAAREWRRTLSLSEREHFDAAAALRDAIDLAPPPPPASPRVHIAPRPSAPPVCVLCGKAAVRFAHGSGGWRWRCETHDSLARPTSPPAEATQGNTASGLVDRPWAEGRGTVAPPAELTR